MSVYTAIIPRDAGAASTDGQLELTERSIYGSSRVGVEDVSEIIASNVGGHINFDDETHQKIGDRRYELSNHLGNVLQVITDRKLADNNGSGGVGFYYADVVSQSDYYPFGMMLPGRHESAADYRYGFQGQEMDDEIKGEGNSVNYKYRMHDPRVGRFFAVDPLTSSYPHYTPYSFSGNKVIHAIELEGLEEFVIINYGTKKQYIIWDITGGATGERGTIMLIDADGVRSEVVPLNARQSKIGYIRRRAGMTNNQNHIDNTQESTREPEFNQTMIKRFGSWKGEGYRFFGENNVSGRTNETYSIGGGTSTSEFSNPSTTMSRKRQMAGPSRKFRRELDNIAKDYRNGLVEDINVQVRTNYGVGAPGVAESNAVRSSTIVDYLVSQGVDREEITTSFLHNQTDWNTNIKFNKTEKKAEVHKANDVPKF